MASSATVMGAGAVEGDKALVPYADCADAILVLVRDDRGRAIVRVRGDGAGLDRIPMRSVDVVSRPYTVRLRGVPVDEVVVHGEDTEAFVQRVEVLAYAMHAARILGVAECLLEMSVEYAEERHQFGRPIGSFQAVQHRLADMRVALRTLRSACYVSQITLAEGDGKAPHWVRVAKAHASNVIRSVAESAVQVHGGIGFTVEHDLHLYLKHGLSLQAMWGDGPQHQQVLAGELIERIAAPQEAIGA